MTSGMIKNIARAYPWFLLAPAILPIVIWGGFIYPYLVPKVLLFYALSLVASATFAVLAAYGHEFFWERLARKEAWIPAALLALAYIASISGIDFYRSFWSLFVRGDGLLSLTCAVADFYLILLYVDMAFSKRLLSIVAIVGSFVAMFGIGEWFFGGGRIGSLLGNAAFFAGYLGLSFFATLAASQTFSLVWRRVAFTGAAFQLVAIILSATRGTILALALAGAAYLAYRTYTGEGKRRTFFAGALIALIAFGGLFFALRAELAHFPFQPIARVASIGTNDPDVASRLFIWRNMVTEIQKAPVLGVGAEHIDVLFNRFYDPTQITEQWFDRSHNTFLDYAAQYGIGGLLLYLALIASFFVAARRFARRGESTLAVIVVLLAVVYAVQNFFVFDTISSWWLLLALLAVFLAASSGEVPRETLPLPAEARQASWLGALILLSLITLVSVRPALAAYDLSEAYKYQLTDVSKETTYLTKGMALGTYGDLEYGYEAYDMYAHQVTGLPGDSRVAAYKLSVSVLAANFNRYPYDARTALYLAHVLSLVPTGVSADEGLLAEALARVIKESPKRSQPWYILANLSISRANTYPQKSAERIAGYTAAQDILGRYIALVPTLSEPHYVLAQLLYASGDTAGAANEAAKGKKYYTSDLETARRATGYYETVLNISDAKFFLSEVVRMDSSDSAAQDDLRQIESYEHSTK